MKHLIRHLKPYIPECILGPMFKLFEACLELMVPLILADIIDNGIAVGDTHYVYHMSLDLVFHGFAGLACALIAQFFAARASVGFTARLKHTLFAHIQTLSNPDIDRIGPSTMVARLTGDMDRLQSGLNLTLRLLLRSPFVVFGAMLMAFTIDTRSALVFLAVIPLLSLVVFGIMFITLPLYKRVQGQTDTVLSHVRENLSGARVLRAFCREPQEIAVFDSDNSLLTRLQQRVGQISALLNPLTLVLINIAIVILLDIGALRVRAGALTTGQVVALYNYLSLILGELLKMANLIISITKALACAKRIDALLDQPATIVGAESEPITDPSAPVVEFRDVSVRFNAGAEYSLSHISFRVNRGDTIGIIGGTGSGKSTLANLINRGYDVTEGAVLVDGADVRSYPLSSLRKKIGMVPQHPKLFRGTIRENLSFGKSDATDEEIMEAVRTAQAEDIITRAKGGLNKTLVQNGRNLSGGQRQRLTIARALVGKPEILILDDSSSSIDYKTAKHLNRAIHALPHNPTVFLISQRTTSLRFADLILVLEEGELVGCGKHDELLQSCAVYREIHDAQHEQEVTNA